MALNIHISGPKLIMHNKTLAEMFMSQLNKNNGLFGIDCSTGKEYSYSKLKQDVFAMATALQNEQIGCGDVVVTTDYGSYEGQVVVLAGLLIGSTVGALNCNLSKKTLAAMIEELKPDVIFCSWYSVDTMVDTLGKVTHRPTLKISTTNHDDFAVYSNMVVSSGHHSFEYSKKSVGKNHPCTIVYSSGTTGIPKGIYLSDDAIKGAIMAFKTLMDEPLEKRFMITSPVFWYTGILLLMLGIHFGKPRLFFSATPSAEQILSSIDKFKPTFLMTGVNSINEMMACQTTNGHKYYIDSLQTIVVGGSPMRADMQKTITEHLLRNRIPIKQGYGATEQGVITLWSMKSDINTVKIGSVGKPGPGIKIRVVSLETGKCVGPNTEGEIRIKSASKMIGYAYDMKKTINSYDENGWFKSGDIGYYTDDGCVYIIGRIKEIMFFDGNRIAPVDVETVLLSHPAVLDAGVTSKDSYLGDVLIGVVKIKPGQNIEPDDLVSYVNDKVEDHEKLRGGVIFVNEVPRSPVGKLNRDKLKNLIR